MVLGIDIPHMSPHALHRPHRPPVVKVTSSLFTSISLLSRLGHQSSSIFILYTPLAARSTVAGSNQRFNPDSWSISQPIGAELPATTRRLILGQRRFVQQLREGRPSGCPGFHFQPFLFQQFTASHIFQTPARRSFSETLPCGLLTCTI